MRSDFFNKTFLVLFMFWLHLPVTAVGQLSTVVDTGTPWNVDYRRLNENVPTWSLFESVEGPFEIGGWMSAGFTANAHGNRTGNGNAPLPINNVADTPVLNQFWLYAEKPLNMKANCCDWGFRIDYLFGADGPDTQALGDQGWDFGWNSSRDYGSAIPQLYGEVGIHDLVLRLGYAVGLQGFEGNQAVDNFFYSHNYGFGYGVPGTFAGAVVEYQVSEQLEVIGGWTTGWNGWWSNHLSASTFMGGLTWTLTDKTSVTYHVTAGDFGDGTAKNGAPGNEGRIYAHAIVLTHTVNERMDWIVENTLGSNTGIGADSNQWYSLTGFLFYDITDCWSAGARLEWFRDDDGRRVAVNGAGQGSYYEATLGLNWQPHSNLRVRPEVRWDWFDGEGLPFDSRDGGITGTAVNQFTGAIDVVLVF